MNKKQVKNMEDKELLEAWDIGCKWTATKIPIDNHMRCLDGTYYDSILFKAGINRIETLEDEMIKRGVQYGKN